MVRTELDNEVTRLRVLKSSYEGKRYLLQDAFTIEYPKRIEKKTAELKSYEKDIQTRNAELEKKPMFEITINGQHFEKHKEAGEFLRAVIDQGTAHDEVDVGMYKGFPLSFWKGSLETTLRIHGSENVYKMEFKSSDTGNMVRLENMIHGLDDEAEILRRQISEYKVDLENARAEYEKPFPYEELLKEKLKRQSEINTQLEIKDRDEKIIEMPVGDAVVPQMAAAAR